MINSKAIVLNRKDFKEHDSLVSFYSLNFGKISLIAKGTRRMNSKLIGHLEPLNLVDLMIIKGRERDYVGSAISENSFLEIKEDYDKIMIAGKAINFLNSLNFSDQVDFNVFLLLKDFLTNLDQSKSNFKYILLSFKIKLLNFLGYNFSNCSYCNNENIVFIDFLNKEFLCDKCIKKKKVIDSNFVKINQSTLNLKNKSLISETWTMEEGNMEGEIESLDNLMELFKKNFVY